ncbi:MAG: hypothetical protein E7H83_24230, partial [Enterobacteriaceae bacterium]|nr:hypothetical protein [Enterobacteriaceae bacterium]
FVGKTLLHGDVLMWLMKTLLTSGCTNQRGAGHYISWLTLPKYSNQTAFERFLYCHHKGYLRVAFLMAIARGKV